MNMKKPTDLRQPRGIDINDGLVDDFSTSEMSEKILTVKHAAVPHSLGQGKNSNCPLEGSGNDGILDLPITGSSVLSPKACSVPALLASLKGGKSRRMEAEGRPSTGSYMGCCFCHGKKLRTVIDYQLYNKYEAATQTTYNVNIINDIILNAGTHIVAQFKEYLLYDDATEFLASCVSYSDSISQLRQLTEFYDRSSKVFPNFVILGEKKYMFKNIERKQKAIDNKYQMLQHQRQPTGPRRNDMNLFTKKFFDELTMRTSKIVPVMADCSIQSIVNHFLVQDSLSQINKSNCTSIEATFVQQPTVKANLSKKKVFSPRISALPMKQIVAKVNNFFSPKSTTRAEQKPHPAPTHRHYPSTDVVSKLNKNGSQPQLQKHQSKLRNGRMSAAGNYCDPLGKESRKPSSVKPPERQLSLRKRKRDVAPYKPPFSCKSPKKNHIDPLQININLNLILNKDRFRSATPGNSTGTDVKKQHDLSKPGFHNAKPTEVQKYEPLSKQPSIKGYHPIVRSRQDGSSARLGFTNSTKSTPFGLTKQQSTPKGRSTAVPQKRKLGIQAIDSLYKNINEMLSPMGAHTTRAKAAFPSPIISPRVERPSLMRGKAPEIPGIDNILQQCGAFIPSRGERMDIPVHQKAKRWSCYRKVQL